jgi:hypothetical protein
LVANCRILLGKKPTRLMFCAKRCSFYSKMVFMPFYGYFFIFSD